MASIWSLMSSFNRGELDPRLVGRKDLQAYYAGAREATNVVTLVQGGIISRIEENINIVYGEQVRWCRKDFHILILEQLAY